jgi:hypothetical protein
MANWTCTTSGVHVIAASSADVSRPSIDGSAPITSSGLAAGRAATTRTE